VRSLSEEGEVRSRWDHSIPDRNREVEKIYHSFSRMKGGGGGEGEGEQKIRNSIFYLVEEKLTLSWKPYYH